MTVYLLACKFEADVSGQLSRLGHIYLLSASVLVVHVVGKETQLIGTSLNLKISVASHG